MDEHTLQPVSPSTAETHQPTPGATPRPTSPGTPPHTQSSPTPPAAPQTPPPRPDAYEQCASRRPILVTDNQAWTSALPTPSATVCAGYLLLSYRYGQAAARRLWPSDCPHRRTDVFYVIAFTFFALALTWTALQHGGSLYVLLWPAVSFLVVASAYAGLGPAIFGKRPNGRRSIWAALLLLPYLAFSWSIWSLRRRIMADPCRHQIAPGIWLGRRPYLHELPEQIQYIVDLTCEFTAARSIPTKGQYLCLPTLDTCTPILRCSGLCRPTGRRLPRRHLHPLRRRPRPLRHVRRRPPDRPWACLQPRTSPPTHPHHPPGHSPLPTPAAPSQQVHAQLLPATPHAYPPKGSLQPRLLP